MVSTSAGKNLAFAFEIACRQRADGVAIENLRLAGDRFIERGAPLRETSLLCSDVTIFIGYIVNQAHEGVERDNAVTLLLWEQKESGIETAMRRARNLVAGVVRGLNICMVCQLGRGMLRPYECRSLGLAVRENVVEQRATEKARLLAFADRRAMIQRVVAHCFNRIEDGDAATAEHFEVDAEAAFHHFRERVAFAEKLARANDEIFHQ